MRKEERRKGRQMREREGEGGREGSTGFVDILRRIWLSRVVICSYKERQSLPISSPLFLCIPKLIMTTSGIH
jgi:hypothetical protein